MSYLLYFNENNYSGIKLKILCGPNCLIVLITNLSLYNYYRWCTQENLCPVASLLNSGAYYDEALHSNKFLVLDNIESL